MSLKFVRASTQSLRSTPANSFSNPPSSWGFWVHLTADGVIDEPFDISRVANVNEGLLLFKSAGNVLTLYGTFDSLNGPTIVTGWHFVLVRWIALDNRRLEVLGPTGAITKVQSTSTTTAILANPLISLGARVNDGNPTEGAIAEFFYTGTDIQPGGGAIDDALLRQLAYRGPFSVSRIRKDIIEYRSFRTHPTTGSPDEVFFGRGVKTWTNTNGVTVGAHPPLSSLYERPNETFGRSSLLAFPVDEGDATVTISGGVFVGSTLTANFGDDDPDGPATNITYQWKADGGDIGGATSSTYLLTSSELNKVITVTVSYTDGDGFSEAVTSDATSAVTATPTGINTSGLTIGKGLSPHVGLSKGKGLSWRTGV